MNLLAVSDTHSDTELLRSIVHKEQPDALLFLGDCLRDLDILQSLATPLEIHAVAGNNDYAREMPHARTLTLAGKRIFITHGHQYRVKMGLELLLARGRDVEADAILFGHTHQPLLTYRDGMLLLNPGSACRFLHQPVCSYAVLTLEHGEMDCEIKTV